MFYTSLERTGAGYFDFYLLHNLGEERTHFFDDYDIWNFLQERKKEGLIRHLGFSMHDKADVLDRILTEHPEMEFVQLQINYADWEDPTIESRKCYEVARKHGKPVIIMEPVKGGTLANPPKEVTDILKTADAEASPSSWAIRFAASLDGVITVLSGMSNMEQMEDNTSYMKEFAPLSEDEQKVIAKARETFNSFPESSLYGMRVLYEGMPEEYRNLRNIPGCEYLQYVSGPGGREGQVYMEYRRPWLGKSIGMHQMRKMRDSLSAAH